MLNKKKIVLYSPDGRLQRRVSASSSIVDVLKRAGWSLIPPLAGAAAPQQGASSVTARRARERISTS